MILVAGEALIDLVIQPDGSVEAALGGAPFNAARAAARLGATVEFGGVLSRDRFGSMLTRQLLDDGVGVEPAVRTDAPTTLAAAELDEAGAAVYRFYIDGTSAPSLDRLELGDAPDVFFTGGLGLLLEPMAGTIAEAVERCPATTLVMVDINCRPKITTDAAAYRDRLDRVIARADIVKVSDEDLAYLSPGLGVTDAANALLESGCRAVLATAGSASTTVVTADGVAVVGVPRLEAPVVDTIGAGDTFAGGLLAWWSAVGFERADIGLDNLTNAVAAAHAAAAVVVTRRGADPPTRAELAADWATG